MAKLSPATVAQAADKTGLVGRVALPIEERRSYARIRNHQPAPPLITVQLESFATFRQEGLAHLFAEISPIVMHAINQLRD